MDSSLSRLRSDEFVWHLPEHLSWLKRLPGCFDEKTSLVKATPTHSLETGGWFILVIFGTVAITSLLPHTRVVVEVKGLVSGSSKVVRMLTRIFLRRAQSVGHHLLLRRRFKGGLFTQSPKWLIQHADPVWLLVLFLSMMIDFMVDREF